MALLLNIDTATEYAGICISEDNKVIGKEENSEQMNHAGFVQAAIQRLLLKTSIKSASIEAVSVTNGPGSYTGLRVGLSSAKGLCYAWKKPLILINTLEVMALAAIEETENKKTSLGKLLFCPMIDARRMEVFTALYDQALAPIVHPCAMIVNTDIFAAELQNSSIIFSGSGSLKLKAWLDHPNAICTDVKHNTSHLASLAAKAFAVKNFCDLAYSEPFYLKEFYNPITIKN